MSEDSEKQGIVAECFEQTLLNLDILSDAYRTVIKDVFRKNNGYYFLKENRSPDIEIKFSSILKSLGYKFNPISNFTGFYGEIYARHFSKSPEETMKSKVSLDLQVEKVITRTREQITLDREGSDHKNRDELLKQVILLRTNLFSFLIKLMKIETIVLFSIVILASLPFQFFKLTINPTTMQILVGATVAQISAMVILIVQSVFPDSLNKIMGDTTSSSNPKD